MTQAKKQPHRRRLPDSGNIVDSWQNIIEQAHRDAAEMKTGKPSWRAAKKRGPYKRLRRA
jgi:hypothetical protein